MTRARLAAVALLTAAVTACGHDDNATLTSRHAPGAAHLAAGDQRVVDIYVAALRAHLAIDPNVASPTWIKTTFRTTSDPVPDQVQHGVTAGLAPKYAVHWVSAPVDFPPHRGSYLELPKLPAVGDRVSFRLRTRCGNVCGTSAQWVVTRHGDHWSAQHVGGIGMA